MQFQSKLDSLAFGEKRPDLTLLEHGVISLSWLKEFETALDREIKASDGLTWSRDAIQASHWVSFYLPLRVRVASHTVGVSHEISRRVYELHTNIEQKLLTSLADSIDSNVLESLSSGHPMTPPELEIVRLSLGLGNPIEARYELSSIGQWKEAFEAAWRQVASSLQSTSRWAKWPIMAARVASFYWDVFFTQNIPLPESFNTDFPGLRPVLPLSTLALIHSVLHPPSAEVDEAGLPIIGPPNQMSKASVRRLVEPILMSRQQ